MFLPYERISVLSSDLRFLDMKEDVNRNLFLICKYRLVSSERLPSWYKNIGEVVGCTTERTPFTSYITN